MKEKISFLMKIIFVGMFLWTRRLHLTTLPNNFGQKAESFLFNVWKGTEKFLFLLQKPFSVRRSLRTCRKHLKTLPKKLQHQSKFFFVQSPKKRETLFSKELFPSRCASRHLVCSHGNNARKFWKIFIKNPKLFDSKSESDEKNPFFANEFFGSLLPGSFNASITTRPNFFQQIMKKSSF